MMLLSLPSPQFWSVVWLGRFAIATTQPSRDSVPYCRTGTSLSGLSKVPVRISMRGPSMRRKLKGVPQSVQKSRSAIEEERNAAGRPRVQVKSLFSISAKEANGAPTAFWHIRQWQMLTLVGGADKAKRTAPHWHPPERTACAASVMPFPRTDKPVAGRPEHRHRR